jgi:hypothetical protein
MRSTWYIAEHPEYKRKIESLRKIKSKPHKAEAPISQEKVNLRNERRKKNERPHIL